MGNVEYAITEAEKLMRNKYVKNDVEKMKETKHRLRENGVVGFWSDERPEISKEEAQYAINALLKNIHERPSILKELEVYRKYVPIMMEYMRYFDKLAYTSTTMLQRYEDVSTENKHKKWTKEEDELLIELVCRDDMSMLQISTSMGRSVPSIKTRVSKLVGMKRLSQEIAGRFVGIVDGQRTDCKVNGIIYKEA